MIYWTFITFNNECPELVIRLFLLCTMLKQYNTDTSIYKFSGSFASLINIDEAKNMSFLLVETIHLHNVSVVSGVHLRGVRAK